MSTHNLCFRAKLKMYTPVHPSFTIQKWGVRGYSLHGLVFVTTLGSHCLCQNILAVLTETHSKKN